MTQPTPRRQPPRTTWWSWLVALAVFGGLAWLIAEAVAAVMW